VDLLWPTENRIARSMSDVLWKAAVIELMKSWACLALEKNGFTRAGLVHIHSSFKKKFRSHGRR
jgi:hypothetical protein